MQGCNVLILCGSGEAFSLFGAIKSANLRAVHLPSAVSSAADSQVTAQPDAVQLTKRRLAAAGECALLASPDQLSALEPLAELFSHAVDYAPSVAQATDHTNPPHFLGFKGMWHVMQLMVPVLELGPDAAAAKSQSKAQQYADTSREKENHAGCTNAMSRQPRSEAVCHVEYAVADMEATDAHPASDLQQRGAKRKLQPSLEYMLGNARNSSGQRAQAMHQMRTRQAEEDATPVKKPRAPRPTPLKSKRTPGKSGLDASAQPAKAQSRQKTLPEMRRPLQPASSALQGLRDWKAAISGCSDGLEDLHRACASQQHHGKAPGQKDASPLEDALYLSSGDDEDALGEGSHPSFMAKPLCGQSHAQPQLPSHHRAASNQMHIYDEADRGAVGQQPGRSTRLGHQQLYAPYPVRHDSRSAAYRLGRSAPQAAEQERQPSADHVRGPNASPYRRRPNQQYEAYGLDEEVGKQEQPNMLEPKSGPDGVGRAKLTYAALLGPIIEPAAAPNAGPSK